jgi:two-component system nitrate/nitrite response regulator NarL
MNKSQTVRAVLADDHYVVRSGIRALLATMPQIEIVGEAANGRQLIEVVEQTDPGLVITDLSMPELDGMRAIAELRERRPSLNILAISMYDTPDFVQGALRNGANGYVMKDATPTELGFAIETVLAGESYLSPRVSGQLVETLRGERGAEMPLTERQRQVLVLIARGYSTKQIAAELGLSPKTVEVHRARLMERLGISDVAGLTLYAVRKRLVDPDNPQ